MLNPSLSSYVKAWCRRPGTQSVSGRVVAVVMLLVLALLMLAVQPSVASQVISLATTEWPPYVSQSLAHNGFASEIMTEAFTRVGYTVKVNFMPWKRALLKVEEGRYDAAYPAYSSKERVRSYALSKPFSQAPVGFYKRKDRSISYRTLRDLQPFRIGVVRGYVNTVEFDAADFLEKDIADNDEQNLIKLLKGRVDLVVIDKLTARYLLNTTIPEGRCELEFLTPPLAVQQMHVLFSKRPKDYEKTRDDFHRGLQQIVDDGTMQQILEKHGLD